MSTVKTYIAKNGKLPKTPDKVEEYKTNTNTISYSKFDNEKKRTHEYKEKPE
jgi:hypothetical protein